MTPRLIMPDHVTVAIIGAGPAGLGVARVLRDLAIPDVWVLERGEIGETFRRWPEGTRLLTPSFPANVFGATDLNAITHDSSPGWSLKREHPDGPDYAAYLDEAARTFRLNVQRGITVLALQPEEDAFALTTDRGAIRAAFVIWAGGQFGTPSDGGILGSDLGRHYATVDRWRGERTFVIGGYESGMDAALGIARAGGDATVLARTPTWTDNDKDPSRALSPYTRQRLDDATNIALVAGAEIIALEREADGIRIFAGDGRSWLSATTPILATGFGTGTGPVAEWFDYAESGLPFLTTQDESTALPGLFLVGPEVSHNGQLFCFIYKFRQRFAVVARAIAGRLGADTTPLEVYRANAMYLDDLSCCEADKCLC